MQIMDKIVSFRCYKCSAVSEMGDRLATIDMRRKLGAAPSNTKSPRPRPTSIPSGILIHPFVWPQRTWAKNWEAVPLLEGELSSHLTQSRPGREAYLRTKWHIDPSSRFSHNRHGPKIGGCAPFLDGELRPHLTQSPWPRPIAVSSGVLILAAVWPQ